MTRLSKYPLTADVWESISEDYFGLIASLSDKEEIKGFFADFFTPTEKVIFIKRFAIALLLSEDFKYQEIVKILKVSPTTIFFIQSSVNRNKYYQRVLAKVKNNKNIRAFFTNVEKTLLALIPPSKYHTKKSRARFLDPDFVDFKEQNEWDRKRKTLVWETTSRTREHYNNT